MLESETSNTVRRLLLAVLLLGIVALGVELLLLEHTETRVQYVPLVVLASGLVAAMALAVAPRRATLRIFMVTMVGFIAAGAAGLVLHYRGNVEFELEMYPDMTGFTLFREALQGATPALAPGAMIQLGLIGLIIAWSHTRLQAS